MPYPQKPFNPQDLYPEAQAVSGMAAKKPTVFSVPFFKTVLLFFSPVFLLTSLTTVYAMSDETTQAALAINSIALFMAILLVILLSIVLFASARAIIVRNCSHPFIIELLYLVFIAPSGYLLTHYGDMWFRGVQLHLVAIQAIILLSETVVLVLIAKAQAVARR